MTRGLIKRCSFAHSATYLVLLAAWAVPGLHPVEFVFGMAHGLGWFAMCALSAEGVRRRLIDVRLAACIAVIGAIGPFVGTAEFVRQDRRRAAAV